MRGSTNGFTAQAFLNKCSKKGKTVIILKDKSGKVFGRFTDLEFDGNGGRVNG